MKKLILGLLITGTVAAAPISDFYFVRYTEEGRSEQGTIIGVMVGASSIREIKNADGSKSYYIPGKTFKEIVTAYEGEK